MSPITRFSQSLGEFIGAARALEVYLHDTQVEGSQACGIGLVDVIEADARAAKEAASCLMDTACGVDFIALRQGQNPATLAAENMLNSKVAVANVNVREQLSNAAASGSVPSTVYQLVGNEKLVFHAISMPFPTDVPQGHAEIRMRAYGLNFREVSHAS